MGLLCQLTTDQALVPRHHRSALCRKGVTRQVWPGFHSCSPLLCLGNIRSVGQGLFMLYLKRRQKDNAKLRRSWKHSSYKLYQPCNCPADVVCGWGTQTTLTVSLPKLHLYRAAEVIDQITTPPCHFMASYCSGYRNVLSPFPTTYWSWPDFFGVERFQEFWISFKL